MILTTGLVMMHDVLSPYASKQLASTSNSTSEWGSRDLPPKYRNFLKFISPETIKMLRQPKK